MIWDRKLVHNPNKNVYWKLFLAVFFWMERGSYCCQQTASEETEEMRESWNSSIVFPVGNKSIQNKRSGLVIC